MKAALGMLKGRDRLETFERWSIFLIFVGLVLFSIGTLIAIFVQQGFPVIIALFGSFITFVFTIVLILVWLLQDRGK